MSNGKKKSKFNPMLILYIVIGAACGFFGADLMDRLENNGVSPFVSLIFMMAAFLLSFLIVPIIHESGHLVMGLLTGYDFVSFRVGSFTVIKENGKLVRKKFNIAGTGGQCILTYKKVDEPQNIPFFWYHFGGVFFNFITAAVCIPIVILADNVFVCYGFIMLALISLVLGIMNIIPTKSSGIGTDGYNLLLLKRSPLERTVLYKTMIINAMQYQGIRLEDIPEDILKFTDEEKQCQLGRSLTILEANILMNKCDFKAAEEKYRYVIESENTLGLYESECKCEVMFCMIMNGYPSDEIESLYNEIKQYIAVTEKTYIMRKRLMYAYYLVVKNDLEKASKEYDLAQKMESTYPAKGEYLSEAALIEYVKANFS